MTRLGSALASVTQLLDGAAIPYMVIGGIANLAWGEPRTTRDIDVTVDVAGTSIGSFEALVREIGDPITRDPVEFAERTRVLPIRTKVEDVEVDFILAILPFELEAISRARRLTIEGTETMICAPADLIVHKVVSERARDYDDVVGVLKRQAPNVDMTNLDRAVSMLSAKLEEPRIAERYTRAKHAAGLIQD